LSSIWGRTHTKVRIFTAEDTEFWYENLIFLRVTPWLYSLKVNVHDIIHHLVIFV